MRHNFLSYSSTEKKCIFILNIVKIVSLIKKIDFSFFNFFLFFFKIILCCFYIFLILVVLMCNSNLSLYVDILILINLLKFEEIKNCTLLILLLTKAFRFFNRIIEFLYKLIITFIRWQIYKKKKIIIYRKIKV